ncbi:RidA family protein [Salirhabdus salicampi]|uniref:RidA family protein n=1 Tax=Salirhabdus salicampi TaxID=476102 RepID=UPI0020C596F9|nr:RidA family protein [Salirhabdus salicampi]MCP8615974.1 RidA family protein [Salirhabdus salicampi]
MNEKVVCHNAPAAIGPYSQAIKTKDYIFISGQIPLNHETGEIPEQFADQVELVLRNIKAIVEEAGSSLEDVVKTTVFLSDINHYAQFNEIYSTYFGDIMPARSAVEVSKLPKDVQVEIETIALTKE